MNRSAQRLFATVSLLFCLAPTTGASAATQTAPDPNRWFAALTPAQVLPFVRNLPTWSSQASTDPAAISFGAAAPTLGYSLPRFDLATRQITGSSQLIDALRPTGSYCARLLVKQSPVNIVVCADPLPDGSGYQISGANEVAFRDGSPDLPSGGTTAPDHNFVGVANDAVMPLDQAAEAWMGASSLDGAVFVRLVAQQKAEFDAIDKINGPAMGGGIPLIGGDRVAVAAFEAAVAKGSGVPVSRLSHPWTVDAVQGSPHHAGGQAVWIVPIAALLALMGAATFAALKRPRTQSARR